MTGLKGSVQLDEVGVVQLVHHLDLIPDNLLKGKTRQTQVEPKGTSWMLRT